MVVIHTTSQSELKQLIKDAISEELKAFHQSPKKDTTILTEKQAIEMLSCSKYLIDQYKAKKLIPYTQIQRKIYFKKEDILTALETLCTKNSKG